MKNIIQIVGGNSDIAFSTSKIFAKNGYDKIYGARPLARLIQESIKKPLAEELLFGSLTEGGTVFVDLKKEKLTIKSETNTKVDKNKKVETINS